MAAVTPCLCVRRPLALGAACTPEKVDPCEMQLHCDCAKRVCVADATEQNAPCFSNDDCGAGLMCRSPAGEPLPADGSCTAPQPRGTCR